MKRRDHHSDSGMMMRCPPSFILGILLAVHYSGNLLLPVANCSLLPHTNNNIHLHQHHQHLPWRRRRGRAVGGISRSSLSFIRSIRGGNDGGTRVVEEYDDISEDDSFAIGEANEEFDHRRSQTDGHASTIISPDATIENINNNTGYQSTKINEETDDEEEKSEEGANETINVVKKDGTLQPLDREKVSSFISCYVED